VGLISVWTITAVIPLVSVIVRRVMSRVLRGFAVIFPAVKIRILNVMTRCFVQEKIFVMGQAAVRFMKGILAPVLIMTRIARKAATM
jgi:hypothetical protein